MCILFFFFSSRRRHTRFKCDWSSDVCSSDLLFPVLASGDLPAFPLESLCKQCCNNLRTVYNEHRFHNCDGFLESLRSEERRVGKECIASLSHIIETID